MILNIMFENVEPVENINEHQCTIPYMNLLIILNNNDGF